MTFVKKNNGENLSHLAREIGYRPLGYTPRGELNCVRRIQGDYPRFHVYLKTNEKSISFNLHLDQKKPSYGNETAHSGEYDGDTVKDEAERIKNILWEK